MNASPDSSVERALARTRLLAVVAFAACSLIWGSTWLAIKVGDDEGMEPMTAAALRFTIAASVLFGIQAVMRIPLPRDRAMWGLCVFVGIVQFTMNYGLVYLAGHHIPSGLSGVLFTFAPLFTSLLAAACGLERLTARKLGGIVIAMVGVGTLLKDGVATDGPWLVPSLCVIGAALCSGFVTVGVKRYGRQPHPVQLTSIAMAIGALNLSVAGWMRGEHFALPRTPVAWIAFLYLALCGSVVAFLLFFWLLRHVGATHTSFISLITPALAVSLGVMVRGEPFNVWFGVGSALVLAGVYVGMARQSAKRRSVTG